MSALHHVRRTPPTQTQPGSPSPQKEGRPRATGRWIAIVLLASLMSLAGCGLEVLLLGIPSGGEHNPPEPEKITKLQGKASGLGGAEISIRAGNAQIAQGKTSSDGSFEIELPAGTDFFNLIVEVQQGAALLKAIAPSVPKEQATTLGEISTNSTALVLILEAALSIKGLQTINYPKQGMAKALDQLGKALDSNASIKLVGEMVKALHEAALKQSGTAPMLQSPIYRPANDDKALPILAKSALNAAALGNGIDYCSKDAIEGCTDGVETSSTPFDLALATAAKDFRLPTCTYENTLQVVITVTIDPNAKDGNCAVIKQFKHAKRYGGTTCKTCKAFLTGGVHKDSGINSPKASQGLSNWEPNQLQMYDDGTNGDLIAGDGIWTLVLSLPAPEPTSTSCQQDSACGAGEVCLQKQCHKVMRIGYKYTYGQNGDVWGGTEEFPGNQRLLEIVDQNGDGFVARHDNFADETANKDKVNTLQKKGATGLICFAAPQASLCQEPVPSKNHPDCGCQVDQDGDGIPDVRERPWDADNDCQPDGFQVFANAQPLTKACE